MSGPSLRLGRTSSVAIDVQCAMNRYTSSGMARGLLLSSGWWCLLLVLTVVHSCAAGAIRNDEDDLQDPPMTTVKPDPFNDLDDIFARLRNGDTNAFNIYKPVNSDFDNIDTSLFDINKPLGSDYINDNDKPLDKDWTNEGFDYGINENDKPLDKDWTNENLYLPTLSTPRPPTYSWDQPTYRYTHHRIIFVPFGAIIFLIALCLRMCLCKRPKPTVAVVRTVAVVVPPVQEQEVTSEATDVSDKPPSYADVQKEDLPPPYAEVNPNPADGQDVPPPALAHEASPSPSEDACPSRPVLGRFRSQYNYKPLE